MQKGKLYLIPASLGENTMHTIPQYVIDRTHLLDEFIVERAKTARRYLKALKTPIPFDQMTFHELNKRTEKSALNGFLNNAMQGKDIGLLSEAGCPGVADPGADIVELAHKRGIEVVPFVGPSSILLALMASGMNGQNFAFVGYLAIKKPNRTQNLKLLENNAYRFSQTQIFIETPYRNNGLIEDMLNTLKPVTRLCIAADLTLPTQFIKTCTIQQWKKEERPNLHKRLALFLIYK